MQDIRSREIKEKNNDPTKAILHTYKYEASDGLEYFLTYEDPEDRTIFSLLRLRIPSSIHKPESQQIYEMTTEAAQTSGDRSHRRAVSGQTIPEYFPELR
jgi:histone acetyltransferase (RNA polymerase elongator complex component)